MERVKRFIRPEKSSATVTIKSVPKNLQGTEVSLPLSLEAVSSAFTSNFSTNENKYVMYRKFLNMDPELNNAITRLALLGQFAYHGVILQTDSTPDDEEKELIKNATEAVDVWDFRTKFFTNCKHCIRDGDSVFVAAMDKGVGIQQIQYLPLALTTCVEKPDQIGKADAIIQKRGLYVVNEQSSKLEQMSKFPLDNPKQVVYHVAMDNDAEEIYDNLGRYTFGIWSESPIDCLKTQVLWKQAVKITDVLWRYRNVPREVHKLDTSMFTPDRFAGDTWEAQIAAAQAAAQTYLNTYAIAISNKKVDQGYVIGSNVTEISYVQPGSGRGGNQTMSQNALIDQINDSISTGIGAYPIGKGTYATELVTASYVILMPDWVSYKVKRALADLLRRHLKLKYGYKDELLQRLDIRLNLVLEILKGELARQVAIIAATNIETDDELRERLGRKPLTDDQKTELAEKRKSSSSNRVEQTEEDQLANARETDVDGNGGAPVTPQSRNDKQNT